MSNLENALQELREKRSRAQVEIEKLDQIISGIESLNTTGALHKPSQPIRIISAASRRKMALAQRARWASVRKQSQPAAAVAKATGSPPAKRTMSAASRKKIAAALRARWAKIRAVKKAA
jgi:phosphopantothenoylcysteine synthetase/decarboxylase